MQSPNQSRLGGLASQYGADLGIPLASLAAGASVASASMLALGNVLVSKVMGPLTGVAYVVYGIVTAFNSWTKSAELLQRAMQAAAMKDALVKQFAEITKSTAVAKQKIEELYQFASKSNISFEGIVKGGAILAKFSNGILLTKKNLELVEGTAAASGQSFESASEAVGEFYQTLANGEPIAESSNKLKDLGVVSSGTISKIEQLQLAGASMTASWDLVTQSLEKAKSAAENLAPTAEQLQGSIAGQKSAILAPSGQIVNRDEVAGLQAQKDIYEQLAPTLTTIATINTRVGQVFTEVSNAIVDVIAKSQILAPIVQALAAIFATLSIVVGGRAVLAISVLTARLVGLTAAAAETTIGTQVLAAGMGILRLAATALLDTFKFFVSPLGIISTAFAALVVEGAVVYNSMQENAEAMKTFADASDKARVALDKQIASMKNHSDQAAAHQQALDQIAAADKEIADVNAERAARQGTIANNLDLSKYGLTQGPALPVGGGIEDMANATTDLQRISNALASKQQAKEKLKKIDSATGLAASNEQNDKILGAMSQAQSSSMADQLIGVSPRQKATLLQRRYDAARNEKFSKEATEKAIAAPGLSAEKIQKILANSGSEEENIRGQLLNPKLNLTEAEKQKLQNRITLLQQRHQAAPSETEVLQANRDAASSDNQDASNAKITALEGQKIGATPEATLDINKQEAESKKQLIDLQVELGDITQEQADAAKSQIDQGIAQQEQLANAKKAQLELEMKIAGVKQTSLELDSNAVGLAKDNWGALQDQVDAINNRKDLTKEEKEQQIQALKISQEQAASEAYRGQEQAAIAQLQLSGRDAALGGNTRLARSLDAQAEDREENLKENQRRSELYQQAKDSGASDADALASSTSQAHQERQTDLAGKALDSLSQISGPVVDSLQRVGGGGGIEASNPLINISQQQLDALKDIYGVLSGSGTPNPNAPKVY